MRSQLVASMLRLCLLSGLLHLVSSVRYQEHQECVSKYGWRGFCKPSWECFALGELVAKGYEPELCDSGSPIACCPAIPQIQNNFLTTTSTAALPQTQFTNYRFHPFVAHTKNPLHGIKTKKKRYPNLFLKTIIHDEDDNTIVKLTPIRPPTKRRKRKPIHVSHKKSFQNSKDSSFSSFQQDLAVQNDELSFSIEKPKSTASQKCQEYAAFAWESLTELSLSNGVAPFSQEFCPGDKRDSEVLVSELPFMVGLGFEDTKENIIWACSGTLISKEYVLTSAHCLHPPLGRPKLVRLGTPHLDLRGHGLEVGVSEVILHPLYNPADRTANIALLKLAPVPTLGLKIRPACLQTNSTGVLLTPYWVKDDTVTLRLRTEEDEVKVFSDPDAFALRKTLSVEVPMSHCNSSTNEDNQICVESVTTNSCESASEGGEPLIQTDKYNQCLYTLIGIAVDKACSPYEATSFTMISPYISWIESIVWP